MVDDFICDPVLAAWWLLSITFDKFQAAAFRIGWWVPNVIDESGFGTGKSLRIWALAQLRSMLIEEQWCTSYYQTFEAGKEIFWPYYNSRHAANPYFRAQLGKVDLEGEADGKSNSKGPACYIQHFKNGSRVMMPAPNWMQNAIGQAGLTLNWVSIDEWTKVETMGKKQGTSTTLNQAGQVTGGINQQILGRLRKANFNQHHMLWKNRCILSATAESTNHPSQHRVNQFQREIAKGNPEYAIVSFCFKDASNLPSRLERRAEPPSEERGVRSAEGSNGGAAAPPYQELKATGKPFKEQIIDWSAIARMKAQFTASHFRREGLGIRSRETAGWYSEEALDRCAAAGERDGLEPQMGREDVGCGMQDARFMTPVGSVPDGAQRLYPNERRILSNTPCFYFLGVDPAPAKGLKADDGALACLRVRLRPGVTTPSKNRSDWVCEYVWAYRLRKASARQWGAFIHKKHREFGFAGICMDSQGGGQWINDELILTEQIIDGVKTNVVPIASLEDMERTGPNVQLLLTMYRRRDPGIKLMWPHLAGDDNLYEAMHLVFQEAVEHQVVTFPKPFNNRSREETAAWPEERQWALKTLDSAREQMVGIQVATMGDGSYALTGHSAKTFSSGSKKKDLAYACIYAYVRFLVWLQLEEMDHQGASGGGGMCVAF
jgi:hypothetical protein